jgi:hypothetical protein
MAPNPPAFTFEEQGRMMARMTRAEQLIREARWLLEQAESETADLPSVSEALKNVREILGQIGGDYRPGEEDRFKSALDLQPSSVDGAS